MSEKSVKYTNMNKKKHEYSEKLEQLNQAKDDYREALVRETTDQLLNILKEEGRLVERDLNLFLGSLALDVKHLYQH